MATRNGLVVTRTTELATEVYSSDKIQAQKCTERDAEERRTRGRSRFG